MEFEYAFLLDALQAERDQGITIDTTQIFFKTKKRKYVFIDAPGHKEFIRNMITGASSADIAILIIDAHEGLKEQTKKHAYLLKLLGLDNVICLFNKMDKINYEEKKFLKVEKDLLRFTDNIGVKINATVPVALLKSIFVGCTLFFWSKSSFKLTSNETLPCGSVYKNIL